MSKILDETDNLQKKTTESINRITSNLVDIESIGSLTLENIRANSNQIVGIIDETKMIDNKLESTKKLQKKFDIWNGSIFKFSFGKNKKSDINDENKKAKKVYPDDISLLTDKKIINTTNPKKIYVDNTDIKINECVKSNIDTNNINDKTQLRLNKINNNNEQIDNSLNIISNSLDKILDMSNSIKDEVTSQNKNLDELENNMSNITTKQENINCHLKKQLKRN